jgi:hypothetical protein
MATISSLAVDLGLNSSQFQSGLKEANKSVAAFAGKTKAELATASASFDKFSVATSALRGFGAAFGIGAGIAGLTELGHAVVGVINDVDALAKEARKIGISFEGLQELRYGFDLAGVAANETDAALEQFSRRVAEAASKGGELADVLQLNGVALRDSAGNVRPLMDLLRSYADLIKNATSQSEKLQLSQIGFGRSGTGMALALADGSKAIDDAAESARQAGVVLKEKLAPAAEKLNDDFAKLQAQISTGFKTAVLESVGYLNTLLEALHNVANVQTKGVLPDTIGTLAGKGLAAALSGSGSSTTPAVAMPPPLPLKPTLLPPPKGGGSARQQRDPATDVISELREELRLVGATDAEIAKSNALRDAGAKATAEQKTEIAGLVDQLYAETKAHDDLQQALDGFANSTFDAFSEIIDGSKSAKDAIGDLVKELLLAKVKADFLKIFNPTAPGGLLSTIFGGLFKAPSFSTGGFTGVGGKNQVAGLVHAGEFVFPAEAVRRIGVPSLKAIAGVPGFADGGYAGMLASADTLTRNINSRGGSGDRIVVQNVVNNNSSAQVSQRQERTPDGIRLITDIVDRHISNGGADRAMRARYGARPTKVGAGS